jgi:hypothetical protein
LPISWISQKIGFYLRCRFAGLAENGAAASQACAERIDTDHDLALQQMPMTDQPLAAVLIGLAPSALDSG